MLLAALTAHADPCGKQVRTAIPFRGTIRAVDVIGERAATLFPVDADIHYVAIIDVESVAVESKQLRAGQRVEFGIHSPTQTFVAADPPIGKTMDLVAVSVVCNGEFLRFDTLMPRPPVLDFGKAEGWLEVGNTYRAEVRWDRDDLTFVERLRIPMHHAAAVTWKNLDAFRASLPRDATRTVETEVAAHEIEYRGDRRWLSVYVLRIVSVQNATSLPAPDGNRVPPG
jgi:hypothetical protein